MTYLPLISVKAYCFLIVLKDLSGLFFVASLLITLSFQVALQDLLKKERIGTFRPQEDAGLRVCGEN